MAGKKWTKTQQTIPFTLLPQFVEQLYITDNTLFFGKKVFRLKVVIH
jgi:hypothetical protein